MDLVTEMLIEVHRIQVLSLIRRNAYFMVNPSALHALSDCLRIPVEECWPLIEELIDEGFVAPLPGGAEALLDAAEADADRGRRAGVDATAFRDAGGKGGQAVGPTRGGELTLSAIRYPLSAIRRLSLERWRMG